MNITWMHIVLMIVVLWLGIEIGRIIGYREIKPIIKTYQDVIKSYRETLEFSRQAHKEIVAEFLKVIEIIKQSRIDWS